MATPLPDTKIFLPRTVLGRRTGFTYIRIVQRISQRKIPFNIEGPVFRPGAKVDRALLGDNAVAIELAGSVPPKPPRRRPFELVWVLWQFDGKAWTELGRAQSSDWAWQDAFRGPIQAALTKVRPLVNIMGAAEEITEVVVKDLDKALEFATIPVAIATLARLNDHVQARMCRIQDEYDRPMRIAEWAG